MTHVEAPGFLNTTGTEVPPLVVRPLTPNLGAQISGVDLAKGPDEDLFRAIHQSFLRHQVLLFTTGVLPPARQVQFAWRGPRW